MSAMEEASSPSAIHLVPSETAAPTMPKRVLLLSSLIALPYRVMRVVAAIGAEVHVLGNRRSRGLAKSRACRSFIPTEVPITGARDLALADEINRAVHRLGIGMVLPGDAQATRALIALSDVIAAPLFPLPDLTGFDLLNNKWRFTQFARELGLLTPQSWLVDDAAELRRMVEAATIPLPAIAKPVNYDGGLGVVKLGEAGALKTIDAIDYAPIIAQEFIPGRDIGASIYA
ncbi:MAG: hypothetical protein ACREE3_10120, partial [Stellaceae bacterium]